MAYFDAFVGALLGDLNRGKPPPIGIGIVQECDRSDYPKMYALADGFEPCSDESPFRGFDWVRKLCAEADDVQVHLPD